ncbi:class I SAM-dependent methyltransferase [Chroococcus sp. FPU101]|uniref:class I SAM-dependent methyltransferase n=1 Tax=Chroococcus sp. FPU101 TaxID=1974212 RepID=UPI001A8C7497|nr:class I SAM-dependent methyltransferase [Chroococcus sp. FPU101]GFE70683.1 Methyltransferase type 11 [Chroococcus sp. FPU101]
MGFYSNFIVPWGLEWAMSDPTFTQYRQAILADVYGEVLEIGVGTGLNLPYYPTEVRRLTMIEPNAGMNRFLQKRIEASPLSINYQILNGEKLPMQDNYFDCVVSTWTLCSIAQVDQAISEIYRVLKPQGKFFFIEHGLSKDPTVQVWQNRLTPLQKLIADGCHLNRPIINLVSEQFKTISLKEFYVPNVSKILGYMYQGVAIKSD